MTNVWDEKPERFIEYGYVIDGLYNAKDMDAWIDKLIMHYEDRILLLKGRILKPRDSNRRTIEK